MNLIIARDLRFLRTLIRQPGLGPLAYKRLKQHIAELEAQERRS